MGRTMLPTYRPRWPTRSTGLPSRSKPCREARRIISSRDSANSVWPRAPCDTRSSGDARKTLAEDYQRMVEDGLLLDDAEPFDALLQRCQALALKVNAAALRAA